MTVGLGHDRGDLRAEVGGRGRVGGGRCPAEQDQAQAEGEDPREAGPGAPGAGGDHPPIMVSPPGAGRSGTTCHLPRRRGASRPGAGGWGPRRAGSAAAGRPAHRGEQLVVDAAVGGDAAAAAGVVLALERR